MIMHFFARGITPKPLQLVKFPFLRKEYVDDHINIIHEDPLVMVGAFHMPRTLSGFLFQLPAHRFHDSPVLQVGISRNKDEYVGDPADSCNIQNQDVLSLLVQNGIDRQSRNLLRWRSGQPFFLFRSRRDHRIGRRHGNFLIAQSLTLSPEYAPGV